MLKQWKHENKYTAYSDTDIVSTFVDIWALPIPCQECNGQSLGPCCLVVPCCLAVVPAVCFEGPTPGDLRHVPKCTFRDLDVKDDLHLFGYRRHNTNFVTIKSYKSIMGSLSLSCFELFSMFWNHKWIRGPHAGGPFCNILSASIRLPTPVPCNGELGCWRLPDKVREDVLKQIETETVPIFHFPEAQWCSCQFWTPPCNISIDMSVYTICLFVQIVILSQDVHANTSLGPYFRVYIYICKYIYIYVYLCTHIFSQIICWYILLAFQTRALIRSQIHPRPRGWPLPWAPELSRKEVYWHRLPESNLRNWRKWTKTSS